MERRFFFNDTATTEIYTLALHDALPISCPHCGAERPHAGSPQAWPAPRARRAALVIGILLALLILAALVWRIADSRDRKSTRLNSSHANTSYAVFCLKTKKAGIMTTTAH